MKKIGLHIILDSIIKTGAIIALIIGASSRQQYSYYDFLRWLISSVSVYCLVGSFAKKQNGLIIFFVAIAILFNPFKKVSFQKETWHLIDYTVAGLFVVTILIDWIQIKKIKAITNETI